MIVIRSLVPGGVAQQDGRLVPGDRLIFVNEDNLENANLDEAVQALKGAPKGTVRIGVAKPLPLANNTFQSTTDGQVCIHGDKYSSGHGGNSATDLSCGLLKSGLYTWIYT